MLIGIFLFAAIVGLGAPATEPSGDVDEAQIERFIAAMPDSDRLRGTEPSPNPADLARLQALNPSRSETVRRILETQARCEAATSAAWTRAALGAVARRMGRDKVDRLIRFYSGPDFLAFSAIQERSGRGEAPSESDQHTIESIMRNYPLMEMAELIQAPEIATSDGMNMLEQVERCISERNAAFDQAGVRQTSAEGN